MPYSRTESTNTVTQIQRSPPAAQKSTAMTGVSPRIIRQSTDTYDREQSNRRASPSPAPNARSNLSSSSSSSPSPSPAQSRLYARRPRFPPTKAKGKGKAPLNVSSTDEENSDTGPVNASDEEEEEDSPAFLPFSNVQTTISPDKNAQDLAATLRRYSRKGDRPKLTSQQQNPSHAHSGSSSSILSSHPNNPSASSSVPSLSSPPGGLKSPTSSNPNALAALSPRHRRLGKEAGSEGTPSMGSSFSDLDDASVTHSAMEEALANQMRAGGKGGMGIGSLGVVGRMGGLWRQGSSGVGTGTGAVRGSAGAGAAAGRGQETESRKSSRS